MHKNRFLFPFRGLYSAVLGKKKVAYKKSVVPAQYIKILGGGGGYSFHTHASESYFGPQAHIILHITQVIILFQNFSERKKRPHLPIQNGSTKGLSIMTVFAKLLSFSLFLTSTLALTQETTIVNEKRDVLLDAIVVGGGPAGLSALSGLARVRRRAILIDSGEYRNGPTRHAHDIIGLDGMLNIHF